MFGGAARLLAARADGLDLLVIDAPHLYARPGNIYMQPDNAFRFGALGLAAARIAEGALGAWRPDVVHAHDWQAGLAPAYLHYRGGARPGTVMTVHNLAFQGEFPPDLLSALALPPASFGIDGVEYYGAIGFLKAGLRLADRVTTVSPSYAAEIRTDAGGMGLGGLLRARAAALSGILNGIDVAVWNPATDTHLAARYDIATLHARRANKAALQRRFGLAEQPDRLVLRRHRPAHLAEGDGPAARKPARARRRATRAARLRRAGAGSGIRSGGSGAARADRRGDRL